MNQPISYRPTYGGIHSTFSWPESNYCAVLTWNDWFRLFDLNRGEFVQEFRIPGDTGGISAAISSDNRFLYLGTYYSWGLACIEISTRKFIWKRNDLKRFYGLSFSPKDGCLYAEFDKTPALKIDGLTGQTVMKLLRVSEVSASPYGDYILTCEPKNLCLRDTTGNVLKKFPKEGFKINNVGWSPRSVAIVECVDLIKLKEEFGTRVYDLQNGALRWRKPRKETYPLGVMYRADGEFVALEGIEQNLGRRGIVVRLGEEAGDIERQSVPADNLKCEKCGRGNFVYCISGQADRIFGIDMDTYETHIFYLGDITKGIYAA